MKKVLAIGFGLMFLSGLSQAKDPVIMTVGGEDVTKSEFEYLYNKNSQQQINPQTLDEYVEMFKLYKMKVADAKQFGLDNKTSFKKEIEQYRHELAAPYLVDSLYLYKLVDEAYARSRKEVPASHIMLFKSQNPVENLKLRHKMDSIKGCLNNGESFEDLARKYSQDRGSSSKGGNMGWMVAGRYPYSFEEVAYNLTPGEISDIVESPVGYHIIRVGESRPARGRVKVAHILKFTRDANKKDEVKAFMDSLYGVLKAEPAKFGDLAKKYSDDLGSARQNGMLPKFGAGEMVEEFDSVSFALKNGEISEPFETPYGYHIVYKLESSPVEDYNTVKTLTLNKLSKNSDERAAMIRKHNAGRFAPNHKAGLNKKTVDALRETVKEKGITPEVVADWNTMAKRPIATVDGQNIAVAEFAKKLDGVDQSNTEVASAIFDSRLDSFFSDLVINAEEQSLEKKVPEYRNLLKEYHDGTLLYDVSVMKVWDRAALDTQGLDRYFKEHKEDYAWTEPHVKGYFVQTVNDSVAQLIKERFVQLGGDSIAVTLRKEFPKELAIEKILIAKGANPMVDHVVWGGPEVESSIAKYQTYFILDPRILMMPEEVGDVKGLVTSDYQNMFQNAWEDELRKTYPVKVNEKVLNQVKKELK